MNFLYISLALSFMVAVRNSHTVTVYLFYFLSYPKYVHDLILNSPVFYLNNFLEFIWFTCSLITN